MKKENLFEKITDLQERFAEFFQHRKKAKSLENYSVSPKFSHKNYLALVQGCLADGFLEEVESKFLDHMLKKYELNYLDWSHRTKWLKRQIENLETKKPKKSLPFQTFFGFMSGEKEKTTPLNIVSTRRRRREVRA